MSWNCSQLFLLHHILSAGKPMISCSFIQFVQSITPGLSIYLKLPAVNFVPVKNILPPADETKEDSKSVAIRSVQAGSIQVDGAILQLVAVQFPVIVAPACHHWRR